MTNSDLWEGHHLDPGDACRRLGIELTSLDETLSRALREEDDPR